MNDTYACGNNKTLNDILKREFGFRGFVTSDWSATTSTMSAAVGLDVRPFPPFLSSSSSLLTPCV